MNIIIIHAEGVPWQVWIGEERGYHPRRKRVVTKWEGEGEVIIPRRRRGVARGAEETLSAPSRRVGGAGINAGDLAAEVAEVIRANG